MQHDAMADRHIIAQHGRIGIVGDMNDAEVLDICSISNADAMHITCERNKIEYVVEEDDHPTAIVEDPICFITLGRGAMPEKRR